MTDYNDGKWHGWNGGECPVHPESKAECVLQNEFNQHEFGGWFGKAGDLNWSADDPDPIIAFRVTKVHREPREFWVNIYESGKIFINRSQEGAYGLDGMGCLETIRVREVLDE